MRPSRIKYILLNSAILIILSLNFSVANAKTVTVTNDPSIKDYNLVLSKIINDFLSTNDPELVINIQPGNYPLVTSGHFLYYGDQVKKISINGLNKNKQKVVFFNPSVVVKPISIWEFQGTLMKPINFEISLFNITFMGNNVPNSKNHPFFGPKATPATCLLMGNLKTFTIKNCTIENIYGNGIVADNSYPPNDLKKYMMQSPLIQNVKIINTWSENNQANSSVGILLGYVKNASVLNCQIKNDLLYSKYFGFVGIDLETRTDGAVIKGNTIEGYAVLIHEECTYGGHVISNNTFRQSYGGVSFSEDCNQDLNKKYLYRPSKVDSNLFYYNGEYKQIGLAPSDWGFISNYKPSFVLDGLQITNNKFKVGTSKTKPKLIRTEDKIRSDQKVYLDLRGQKNVTQYNNTFE